MPTPHPPPAEPVVLACDIGGTRLKIGLVRSGSVLARTVEPARSHAGFAEQLPVLEAAWRRLLDESGLPVSQTTGISMAFPSVIEVTSGRILDTFGKFADAPHLDLRAWARERFQLPLAIENDARMALIGEWQAGAGRGCDDLVMMTLGTGLGTAAVIQGRVLRGRHGQAGILGGHSTLRPAGHPCPCGNIGCAETEASTAHLARMAAERPDYAASPLSREPELHYQSVFHHAAHGDPCATALRDHSLLVWSSVAVNLVHAYDPSRIVVGGGIMGGADTVLPALRAHVHRYAHTPWGQVDVVRSTLSDDAALLAGEWLLREQFPS